MDHVVLVSERQRRGDLAGDADRVLDRELLLALEPVAQRLALHVRHHEIEQSVGVARVVEREDVGMLEPGDRLDLMEEPVAADEHRDLGSQDLDRDRPAVPQVLGKANDRAAALPQHPLDGVAFGQD